MGPVPEIEVVKKLPMTVPEEFGSPADAVEKAVELLKDIVLDIDVLFNDDAKDVIMELKYNSVLKKLCSSVDAEFCRYPDAYALVLIRLKTRSGRLVRDRKVVAGAAKPISVLLTNETICVSRRMASQEEYFIYEGSSVSFLEERVKQGERFTSFLVDCIPVAYSPRSGAKIYKRYIPFRMYLVSEDGIPAVMIVATRTLVKRILKVLASHARRNGKFEVRIKGELLRGGTAEEIVSAMKRAGVRTYSESAGFGDLGRVTRPDFLPGLRLRDYQLEAVNSALSNLELMGGSIIMAPTGSGKTEMAVALAGHLLQKGAVDKVVFTAFSKDLAIQARDRFAKYGISAELIDNTSQIGRMKYARASTVTAQSLLTALTAYTVRKSLEAMFGMSIEEIMNKYGKTFIDLLRDEEARGKALSVLFPATIAATYPFYGSIFAAVSTTDTNIGGTAKLMAFVESVYEEYRKAIADARRRGRAANITPIRMYSDLIALGALALDVLIYMNENKYDELRDVVDEIKSILRDYYIKYYDEERGEEVEVNLMYEVLNKIETKLRVIKSRSTAAQALSELKEMFGEDIYHAVVAALNIPALAVSALAGVTVDPVKLADCILDKSKCGRILMSLVMLEKVKSVSDEVISALEGKKVLLIVDEVHHAAASTMMALVSVLPRTLRLGLSATPWRGDGLDIAIYETVGDLTDYRISYSELIRRGYLSKVLVKFEMIGSADEATLWYTAAVPFYLMTYNMLKYGKKAEAGPSDRTKYRLTNKMLSEIKKKSAKDKYDEIVKLAKLLERFGMTFAPEDKLRELLDALGKNKLSEVTTPEAFLRAPADVGALLGAYTPQWIKNNLIWQNVWRFLKYTRTIIYKSDVMDVFSFAVDELREHLPIGAVDMNYEYYDIIEKALEENKDPVELMYSKFYKAVEELAKEAEESEGRRLTIYGLAKKTYEELRELERSGRIEVAADYKLLLTALTANMLGLSQIEATAFTNAVNLLAATSPITVDWLVQKLRELISEGNYPIIVMHEIKEPLKFLYSELKRRAGEIGISPDEIELIVGDISPAQRKEILDKTRRNQLKVVLAISRIADEGLDIPSLKAIIDLFASASVTKLPQRIGRLTRPYPGKEYGIYIVAAMKPFPLGEPIIRLTERKYEIIKVYQRMLSEAFEGGRDAMIVNVVDLCEKEGIVDEECLRREGLAAVNSSCQSPLGIAPVLELPRPTPSVKEFECRMVRTRAVRDQYGAFQRISYEDRRRYAFAMVYDMSKINFVSLDNLDVSNVWLSVPFIWIGAAGYVGWPFGRVNEKTFAKDLVTYGRYNEMINDLARYHLYKASHEPNKVRISPDEARLYVKHSVMRIYGDAVLENYEVFATSRRLDSFWDYAVADSRSYADPSLLKGYFDERRSPTAGLALKLADAYGVTTYSSPDFSSPRNSKMFKWLESFAKDAAAKLISKEEEIEDVEELFRNVEEPVHLGYGVWLTRSGVFSPCGVAVTEEIDKNIEEYFKNFKESEKVKREIKKNVCEVPEQRNRGRR